MAEKKTSTKKTQQSNTTKTAKLVYSVGEHDETLGDIILQIWNDGAEGIIYANSEVKEFEERIKRAIDKAKHKKGN